MSDDLDPRAVADLARSGLASTDLLVTNAPGANSFAPSAGYLIPYFRIDGSPHPKMHRVRYYDAELVGKRYTQPDRNTLGEPNPPYFASPALCDYSRHAPYKLIVEGEKKAVAAIKFLGLPSVGIGGCWNWCEGRSDEEKFDRPHDIHKITPALLEWVKRPDTKRVEIVLDSDMLTKEDVSHAGSAAWWMFRLAEVDVRFVVLPDGAGGLDDWIATLPEGTARTAFDALPRVEGWELPFQSRPETFHALGIPLNTKTGLPADTNESTLRKFLQAHPRFAGRLWVDTVKHRCMLDDEPFGEKNTFEWLCALQQFFPKLTSAVNYQVMTSLAWHRERNRITEWLDTLRWDGTPRLERFASRYLKQEDTPYTARAFANFLVAAIARMYVPGTKFDHMLVLQGPQGIGKTRLLTTLFGKDYACIAPHTTAVGSRDWLDAAGSGWCLILDELAGLTRVEHTELKTALSTEIDTYRRAYRRDPESFYRMFVLAGTTNEHYHLTDPTGNRRYWPVMMKEVLVSEVANDRDQLWAEARYLHSQGYDFWLLPPDSAAEAQAAQEAAHVPDQVEEVCEQVLARARASDPAARPPAVHYGGELRYFVGTMELMLAVSGEEKAFARNAGLSKRIRNAMLQQTGWAAAKVFDNGAHRRGYVRRVKDADGEPRTQFETTWEAEFGMGSKF